jgi:predicted transcriptional regulator
MMESNELKFVLKLLGCNDYRSLISAPVFDSFKQDKSKICHALSDRGYLDFDREIISASITSAGKNVLKMDITKLPITPAEHKILQVMLQAGGKVVPSQMKGMKNIKAIDRDRSIGDLAAQGLVKTESGIRKQKAEVWLTQKGQNFLRHEFTAKSTHPTISLDLLTNYLLFLRKPVK